MSGQPGEDNGESVDLGEVFDTALTDELYKENCLHKRNLNVFLCGSGLLGSLVAMGKVINQFSQSKADTQDAYVCMPGAIVCTMMILFYALQLATAYAIRPSKLQSRPSVVENFFPNYSFAMDETATERSQVSETAEATEPPAQTLPEELSSQELINEIVNKLKPTDYFIIGVLFRRYRKNKDGQQPVPGVEYKRTFGGSQSEVPILQSEEELTAILSSKSYCGRCRKQF